MPHFGLMSTKDSFDSAEGALLRARLHIRGGRQRLTKGEIADGIVTLYDALIFALRFYLMIPEHRNELVTQEFLDLTDEKVMIKVLREARILDDIFDLDEFEDLVDKAAVGNMSDFDYRPMLSRFESLMTLLEVMPFEEALLPSEEISAF